MYERTLRISERVYGAMLVLYPKGFRDAYGPQMVQVFRDKYREAVERAGIIGLGALWARTVVDFLFSALAERRKVSIETGRIERLGYALRLQKPPSRSYAFGVVVFCASMLALYLFVVGAAIWWEYRDYLALVPTMLVFLGYLFLAIGDLLYAARRRVAATLLYAMYLATYSSSVVLAGVLLYQLGGVWVALPLWALVSAYFCVLLWRYFFSVRGSGA